jgi:ABC-type bacteriocin/lantibiotic exporter with double-glycine peptidase domain
MPEHSPLAKPEPVATPPLRDALRQGFRFLRLLRAYWPALGKGMLLGFAVGGVGLIPPMLSKLFFDRVYPAHDATLLTVLVAGVLVVSVTNGMLGGLKSYYVQVVGAKLTRATSLLFFNHLQHLPVRFFDEHRVGEVTSRFQDVRASLSTVTRSLETIFVSGAYVLLIPPILIYLNPTLAVIAFITVPLTSIISTLMGHYVRRLMKQSMEAGAELSAFQVEALSHVRTLKAMGAEHHVFRVAASQLQRALQLQLKSNAVTTGAGVANGVLRTLGQALFSWYAWTLILGQQLTLGDFVAFTAYMTALSGPVGQFAALFVDFQQSAVSLGRMFEYLDLATEQPPELAYAPPAPIVHRLTGAITLDGVSFGYVPDRLALDNVSLSIPAGSITAIVGPSGAGKSSLLRLLSGMERPNTGTIAFDGRSLPELSLADLRRQLSVVWQEFSVLRGTMWENLTLGLTDVPRDVVDDAIRACQLSELVTSLPLGYETPIGEWGSTLSGGQRQRLMLARALIRNAPIFLKRRPASTCAPSARC